MGLIHTISELDDFKLFGLSLVQIEDMRKFAINHGWKPKQEKTNG